MPRPTRSALVLLATAFLGSVAIPTAAAGPAPAVVLGAKPKPPLQGKKPIAVGTIAGKRAGKVRSLIFQNLKESNAYEVADVEDLKPGDKKATIAKSAKAVGVKGVILGRVSEKYDLTLNVYNADGKLIREVTIKGGTPEKLENAVRNEFNLQAGEALALATGGKNLAEVKPPTEEVVEEEEEEDLVEGEEKKEEKEEEPDEEESEEEEKSEDEDKEDEDKEDEKKSKPSKPGRDPLEVHAGVRGYNRNFGYTAAVTALLPYKLDFGPALLVGGRIYPLAFSSDDFSSNLGLIAQAELGIATTSNYRTPAEGGNGEVVTELKNEYQEWYVGVIGRIPLDPVELAISIAYGQHTFILTGDEGGSGLPPLVPDVRYGYIRPGVEVRARPSDFLVGARVAPRILASYKNIDQEGIWFPGASGFGFDFGLMGGYSVLPFLDVVAGFDFVRYSFDFSGVKKNPPPACATLVPETPPCQKVAEGASDQYISGWLGAMFRIGGSDADKKK